VVSGGREPKLMSVSWTPAECSVVKNTLDWLVESGAFYDSSKDSGLFMNTNVRAVFNSPLPSGPSISRKTPIHTLHNIPSTSTLILYFRNNKKK